MKIIENKICKEEFYKTLNPSEICAGDKSGTTCGGDSGGPLSYLSGNKWELCGVVSRAGGDCNQPTVYTRVTSYLDWIESNLV